MNGGSKKLQGWITYISSLNGWISNYPPIVIMILQLKIAAKIFKHCKSEYFIDRDSSNYFLYFSQGIARHIHVSHTNLTHTGKVFI